MGLSDTSRRGMGLVEIILAAIILSFVVGYAMQGYYYGAKSVRYTDRVDNLRSLRQMLTTVARDLENCVELVKPSYGTAAYELVFRNERYQLVRYMLTDDTMGVMRVEADIVDSLDKITYLVRTVDSDDPATGRRIVRNCRRLHWVKFSRLGRNLLGISIMLKKKDEGPGEEKTLFLDTVVNTKRVLN